jgi:hypothetical protein|nr:MAG TPA: lysozyme [Caudoviricetes sp.]
MRTEYITSERDEEMQEILRGLELLLSVPEGTLPCNRNFGISWSNLDLPQEELETEYATALILKAAEYIPEIEIREVKFAEDKDGERVARIEVERA